MDEATGIMNLAKHWEVLISLLIVGLVQVLKTAAPNLPGRIIPLTNVVLGIGFMLTLAGVSVESAIAGMMIGFAASGIWSGGKAVHKS